MTWQLVTCIWRLAAFRHMFRKLVGRKRFGIKGQTAVEYILTTLALLVMFVMMYRYLQRYLTRDFTSGARVIAQVYIQSPS